MVLKIEKDHQRFRQIVKGRIRDDLRKFLTKGELIGKEGKHLISIPVRGDRAAALPLRRQLRRRRRRRRQGRRRRRQGPAGKGKSQGGTEAGPAHHGGRPLARRAGRDPRRGAEAPAHRAQGQAPHHDRSATSTAASAASARTRCATSSGRSRKRSSGRS